MFEADVNLKGSIRIVDKFPITYYFWYNDCGRWAIIVLYRRLTLSDWLFISIKIVPVLLDEQMAVKNILNQFNDSFITITFIINYNYNMYSKTKELRAIDSLSSVFITSCAIKFNDGYLPKRRVIYIFKI